MNSNRPPEIFNYKDPVRYSMLEGIGVCLPFCLTTSKIMEKYGLTFPQACGLLEAHGYLSWVGKVPFYNLAGERLWLEKPSEKKKNRLGVQMSAMGLLGRLATEWLQKHQRNVEGYFPRDNETDFPWGWVKKSRKDSMLQREHPIQEAAYHLESAKSCPNCGLTPDKLSWFYFRSPKSTWAKHAGRGGWMTVCEKCEIQVDFFLEEMN